MGTLVESKITNSINMKACIVLIVLAVAVQAQKFEPAKCDYSKEIYCSGTWNEDWTEQITADFCIPMQNGDCWNYCPTQCCKDSVMCPGKMDPKGCKEPDFCHHGKFCPVNCDWEKEMMCLDHGILKLENKLAQICVCLTRMENVQLIAPKPVWMVIRCALERHMLMVVQTLTTVFQENFALLIATGRKK